MELILQKNLPHQQRGVNVISQVFEGVEIENDRKYYANPIINLSDDQIVKNIEQIQRDIPNEYINNPPVHDTLNIDIKMETGTGKTYVYTKAMHELHKNYGFNKFIIAVPSLAIKAGTGQFLKDEYVKKHFTDICNYDTEVEVGVLESQTRRKGRLLFPSVVSDFVKGSMQVRKKIYVLLVNMQLLTSNIRRNGRSTGLLWRDDYDGGAEGFFKPFSALRATRPIVIIDEPHRFSRNQKAFKVIMEKLSPQVIIRFGATFPELPVRKKNKSKPKDYRNLLYNLNACDSFNHGLIKGVSKEHLDPISGTREKVKITTINRRTSANFQHKKQGEPIKTYTLGKNDPLSIISNAFEGITISGISSSKVTFSNGVTKTAGEELDVDIYMTSYQEQMLRLAIKRHFETERANFCGRKFKIKTLSLFFIDDILSYRDVEDGKEPYLLKAFERLLKEQIEKELTTINKHEKDYKKYLQESLSDIPSCHAGYFARDNKDTDKDIAMGIDIILNRKKQLLSFKNPDGSCNTLRFLFSKWTLKEGWDNPNVFTIAKLRSSGSETSKLQEVGRGLRLPVDENGNRISNEEFSLNYIVDFTEADFAQKLIDQINGELPRYTCITEDDLIGVAKKRNISAEELFGELYTKKYIDRHRNIITSTKEALFAEYPEFATGLKGGKIENRNKHRTTPIKIRKSAYYKIKELWEKINQKYLLLYDDDVEPTIEDVIVSILHDKDIFTDIPIESHREIIEADRDRLTIVSRTGVQYLVSKKMPYGEFLKRIVQGTNIPIQTLHQAFLKHASSSGTETIEQDRFNEKTAITIIQKFREWKNENLQKRFRYKRSDAPVGATVLTHEDGSPRDRIAQGRIGIKITEGVTSDNYLYDTLAYDSPLEKENIKADINEIIVYGKIPRSSIAIPTITGGTYTPDFMYIVKKSGGTHEINIVIETKDVENKTITRGIENTNINCAKLFFEILSKDGFKVHFKDQLKNKKVVQIIEDILSSPSDR